MGRRGAPAGCRAPAPLTAPPVCLSSQVHTTDFPGNYPGYEDAWDQRRFEEVGERRRRLRRSVAVGRGVWGVWSHARSPE